MDRISGNSERSTKSHEEPRKEKTEFLSIIVYFDAQNGLLVRKNTIEPTVLLPLPDQIDFLDYRDVDGVKIPFTIRYSGIDTFNSWTRTFTEIKRNSVVDDALFAMPSVEK